MRRPLRAAAVALCSLVLALSGCGGDDDGRDTSSTTTEATTEGETTTAPEAEDAEVDCDAYLTVVGLIRSLAEIGSGSDEGQVAADGSLGTAVEALTPSAEGDEIISEALATLGEVSFQATDADTGPSADEIDGALVTIEDAWSDTCAGPVGCPDTDTLEAEGLMCDAEGNITPVE